MRVGFLTWRDLAHPQAGGSEVLIDRLALGCMERGHEVSVMCGGPVGPRPYPVQDIGGTFSQYLRAPFAHARAERCDVLVDVENGVPFFSPLWRRRPVVCFVHHLHAEQWRQRFSAPIAAIGENLERYGMPRAYRNSHFIAISPSTVDSLVGIGVPAEQIHLVFNGVDVPADTLARRSPEPLFLALGRLVPHKRIPLLLKAWARVYPHVGGRLVVAGDGPDADEVRELAGPGVEVLGAVSEERKRHLLESSWLLVHPAMHEGWGIVILEAAAHGAPALAFDVPGVRDAVVHDRTGILVETEDQLVEHWIELARDAPQRERLAEAARSRAEDFTWGRSVDRFLGVLDQAVTPRSQLATAQPAAL